MIAAEDLVGEVDLIDLAPILNDERVYPWVWQPFGNDEAERQRAIESARMVAECEYAAVESVEAGLIAAAVAVLRRHSLVEGWGE